MYISITHFKVKAWWALPLFQWHAFRSHGQAHKSKGIIAMEVWPEQGNVFCTLTHWESKRDMLHFRNKGCHLKAMKASAKMGEGCSYGWESDNRISRPEARQKLVTAYPLNSLLV